LDKIQLLSLKNQKVFDIVSKQATKYICRYFIITASRNILPQQNFTNNKIDSTKRHAYCGFKISRKYGKANQRNLLKRRVKNILHSLLPPIALDINFIFIPRVAVKTLEFNDLSNELEKSLNWLVKKI